MNYELLQQVKDEVAIKHGFDSFKEWYLNAQISMSPIRHYHDIMPEIAEAYHAAKEKQNQLIVELGNEEQTSEVKQVGEPCFTDGEINSILRDYKAGECIPITIYNYLNTRANEYAMQKIKKVIANILSCGVSFKGGTIAINKDVFTDPEIINPKDLEV